MENIMATHLDGQKEHIRVARPRAQHLLGREATNAAPCAFELPPSFHSQIACICRTDAIGRGWSSLFSLRDPAALRDGGATR
jgi:hypothetical protein